MKCWRQECAPASWKRPVFFSPQRFRLGWIQLLGIGVGESVRERARQRSRRWEATASPVGVQQLLGVGEPLGERQRVCRVQEATEQPSERQAREEEGTSGWCQEGKGSFRLLLCTLITGVSSMEKPNSKCCVFKIIQKRRSSWINSKLDVTYILWNSCLKTWTEMETNTWNNVFSQVYTPSYKWKNWPMAFELVFSKSLHTRRPIKRLMNPSSA